MAAGVNAFWIGKTSLTLLMAAHVLANPERMRNGGRVAFFDMENTYDPNWAEKLGVDTAGLHLYQPDSMETALDAIDAFLDHQTYDLIVYDSIAEAPTKAELEGSMDDNHVGTAARKYSQWRRGNKSRLARSNTALVFINQISMAIGVLYGDPTSEFGGRALKYAATIRIKMLTPVEKDGKFVMRPKVIKNKTAPKREGEIAFYVVDDMPYLDEIPELIDVGKNLRVFTREDGSAIKGNGTWFFQGQKLGTSELAVKNLLAEDDALRLRVEEAVYQAIELLNHPPKSDPREEEILTDALEDES